MGKRSFLIITVDELSVDFDRCKVSTSLKKARVEAMRIAAELNDKHRTQKKITFDYLQKINEKNEWGTYDGKATITILEREYSKIKIKTK
jgi:hypothetical protein